MNFKNEYYISKGVDSKVNPLLQIFMWQCIDNMPPPKDYLQVFELSVKNGKQKITHIQEEPEYQREYLIISDAPFLFNRKSFNFLLNKNNDFISVQDFRLCRNAHGKTKRV